MISPGHDLGARQHCQGADVQLEAPPYAPIATWAGRYLGIQGGIARHDAELGRLDSDAFLDGEKPQKNAWMPVCARPRISAWMSCVPS